MHLLLDAHKGASKDGCDQQPKICHALTERKRFNFYMSEMDLILML